MSEEPPPSDSSSSILPEHDPELEDSQKELAEGCGLFLAGRVWLIIAVLVVAAVTAQCS